MRALAYSPEKLGEWYRVALGLLLAKFGRILTEVEAIRIPIRGLGSPQSPRFFESSHWGQSTPQKVNPSVLFPPRPN